MSNAERETRSPSLISCGGEGGGPSLLKKKKNFATENPGGEKKRTHPNLLRFNLPVANKKRASDENTRCGESGGAAVGVKKLGDEGKGKHTQQKKFQEKERELKNVPLLGPSKLGHPHGGL